MRLQRKGVLVFRWFIDCIALVIAEMEERQIKDWNEVTALSLGKYMSTRSLVVTMHISSDRVQMKTTFIQNGSCMRQRMFVVFGWLLHECGSCSMVKEFNQ